MGDAIVVAILVVVLFVSLRYIVKEKKKGHCIGCKCSNGCNGKCNSNF